jgi:hypothetical protein
MIVRACETESGTDARKASERRVAATEFYLQHAPPHMRRLNVHRLVEIVARGTQEGASARLAGLSAAVLHACDSDHVCDADLHAAMLTRAGCLMDIAYLRTLNVQGGMLHQQGGLNVRCFMRERAAPCKPPYRCAASRRKMRGAGLSWEFVQGTVRLLLAKLEPSIVRTIREERIGGALVYTDEGLIDAARCNIGIQVPTRHGGVEGMGAHTLRVLVLAYMHPDLRPEVVRRWGPLSFFATSSVHSLSHLFSAAVGVHAVQVHGAGDGVASLLAQATRQHIAEASARLPLFSGDLMWDTGQVQRMKRAFASGELEARVGHWNVSRVATHRACWK